jgi:FkbM family methyltransferase
MLQFALIVPFRPKSEAQNWETENEILYQTVSSLLNQTYTQIHIYVVYTDMPTFEMTDNRLTLVPFPFGFKNYDAIECREELMQLFKSEKLVVRRWDKGRKLSYGAMLAKQSGADYIMAFDSDDRLTKHFFEWLNQSAGDQKPAGWYIEKGYLFKEGSNYMIRIPRNMRYYNGSTHVLRSDLVCVPDFNSQDWNDFNLFTDHGWIKDRMKETYGVELLPVMQPSLVYVVHGSNMSKVKQAFALNIKGIAKRIIRGVWLNNDLRREFFLEPRPVNDTLFFSFKWLSLSRFTKILQFIKEHPLAGRNKWKYYKRFFYWQISQRFFAHDQVWRFTSKTKLVLRRHLIGATGNLYTGLQDFAEMGFVLHFLRSQDLFADIGANAGSYTVLASGHAGAKSLVFEPMQSTLIGLKKNININHIQEKTELHTVALGDVKTTVRFSNNLDAENHVLPDWEKADETLVKVEPFDDLFYPSKVPLLAKIDVEGYETAVLKGMRQTVADDRLKAIIIELNGSGYRYDFDEKQIHLDLLAAGFRPYAYEPYSRQLTLLEIFGANNTIYIRDVEFAKQRLQTAEKVHVNGVEF